MEDKNKSTFSGAWYMLGGLAVGAVAGLLLAPKKGSETREEIGDWTRRSREQTRSLLSRISAALPTRVKAAAAIGAVKGGVNEVLNDKAKPFNIHS